MTTYQIILGVVAAISLALLTLKLTQRRLISERITLLWLAVAVAILVCAIFPQLAFTIAGWLGFVVTANAIFTFSILGLLLFNLYVTTKLSILDQRIRRLAQDFAIARASAELRAAREE